MSQTTAAVLAEFGTFLNSPNIEAYALSDSEKQERDNLMRDGQAPYRNPLIEPVHYVTAEMKVHNSTLEALYTAYRNAWLAGEPKDSPLMRQYDKKIAALGKRMQELTVLQKAYNQRA